MKGCRLIFLKFVLLLKGRGVEVNFFFPPDVLKGGRRRGERGTFRFLEMFLSREGFTGGNFFLQIHYGTG